MRWAHGYATTVLDDLCVGVTDELAAAARYDMVAAGVAPCHQRRSGRLDRPCPPIPPTPRPTVHGGETT